MERILPQLLDWKLQFQDYKTLILTGSTAEDRKAVIMDFAKMYFENAIQVNLSTNEEIRNYIETKPVGRDAYHFIEHATHDLIVPLETILIFDHAEVCQGNGIWDWAENFFQPEDMSFMAILGDFTPEELEKAESGCVIVELPDRED